MSASLLRGHDYVKHPVIYLHTKPSPRERNMSASQKEWLATIRALDKLRSCVFSQKKFTLWTNHHTLTWLRAEWNRNANTRSDGLGSFCFSKWIFNMFLVGKECLRKKKKKKQGGGEQNIWNNRLEDTGHQPTKTMVFEKKDTNEMSPKPNDIQRRFQATAGRGQLRWGLVDSWSRVAEAKCWRCRQLELTEDSPREACAA